MILLHGIINKDLDSYRVRDDTNSEESRHLNDKTDLSNSDFCNVSDANTKIEQR